MHVPCSMQVMLKRTHPNHPPAGDSAMLVMPAVLLHLLGQLKPRQLTPSASLVLIRALPPDRHLRPALLRPLPAPAPGVLLTPAGGRVISPVGACILRRSQSLTTPSQSLLLIMVCSFLTNKSDVTLRRVTQALLVFLVLPGVCRLPAAVASAAAACPCKWPGVVAVSMRSTGPSCVRRFAADQVPGLRKSHSRMAPSRDPETQQTPD